MSTKRDKYLRDTPTSHSEGAFKAVEIYDTFVYKRAKEYEDYDYDDEDYFDYYENLNEIRTEIDMLTKYSHLPIYPKLLWVEGDETGFAMEKVKTYDEIMRPGVRCINYKLYKQKKKRIYAAILKKLKVARIKTNMYSLSCLRLGNLIQLGLKVGMSCDAIANDLYLFVMQERANCVLRDAHSGNVGYHKGHLVMFDLGQIYERSRVSFQREMAPDISWDKKCLLNEEM